MRKNKWQLNRAGLFNFWYYSDEIFHFTNGKLLLRGNNGSGKSVTMQSILPLLLDGRKSPDRLDPFGSRARKIEDYLLGEKEIVDRDERTGYLFIEYKRQDTEQYITTGIGMQARRHKAMNSWYFVLLDNRRIGEDFFLYEEEMHRGEKQRIPLSRSQLENRIADGGQVVRTQKEYMQLVNQYIFGFEEMESYEDLIKLLIQLRSPKLSKEFKPTVIYEILEAALPALTDEDLRHLSDTIEHMDQTKQQIDQLEREHDALESILKHYDNYNQYRLHEAAKQMLDNEKKYKRIQSVKQSKEAEREELELLLKQIETNIVALEQEKELLSEHETRLNRHEVWHLQREKMEKEELLMVCLEEIADKDEKITTKQKMELRVKGALAERENELRNTHHEIDEWIEEMEHCTEYSAFAKHTLNVEDFERKRGETYPFTMWKKEATNYYELLDHLSKQLSVYDDMKRRMIDLEDEIARLQKEMDDKGFERGDWERIFTKDKQTILTDIYRWIDDNPVFDIQQEVKQETARAIDVLYEQVTFESVRARFQQVANEYEQQTRRQIATKESEKELVEETIKELETLLEKRKTEKDPAPPNQREETERARSELSEQGIHVLPFYEAVEFKDHVDESVRKKIEAALIDTNLIDALIANEPLSFEHDRIIRSNPQMLAHTLADYLVPDVPEDSVSKELVDEVLRSILIDETSELTATIGVDGTYQIGLIEGHAIPVEKVRFIGKNARKRYREEQIAQLEASLQEKKAEHHSIEQAINQLYQLVNEGHLAMERFPGDDDLRTSYEHINDCEKEIELIRSSQLRKDQKLEKEQRKYVELKRMIEAETRTLDIPLTRNAFEEAKKYQRNYERQLSNLEKAYSEWMHTNKAIKHDEERLADIIADVDELKGERNILLGKKEQLTKDITAISEQMKMQGLEEVQKEIINVQKRMAEVEKSWRQLIDERPRRESEMKVCAQDVLTLTERCYVAKHLAEAWRLTLKQELQFGFIKLPEELEKLDDKAKWVRKNHPEKMPDISKIEEHLTKTRVQEAVHLYEYRITEMNASAPEIALDMEKLSEADEIIWEDWRNKSERRLLQLDFEGMKTDPYYVRNKLFENKSIQQARLSEEDEQLYKEILFEAVGKKLRNRIHRAQLWTKKMNTLMKDSDSTSGISFSIHWRPRTAEAEAELDTRELVEILQRDVRLLKEEDLQNVMRHFRSRIERAKELLDSDREGNTLLQVLKEVLDYRHWFSFVLSFKRTNEHVRELTNHAFDQFSGGEKAMAMYIPLFTACYSRYQEADDDAPYIISLDEAFAGVDDENISAMFRILEQLDFDYMMNSQILWGDFATVSGLSIYELVRAKNADFVTVFPYVWDGKTRKLVDKQLV